MNRHIFARHWLSEMVGLSLDLYYSLAIYPTTWFIVPL